MNHSTCLDFSGKRGCEPVSLFYWESVDQRIKLCLSTKVGKLRMKVIFLNSQVSNEHRSKKIMNWRAQV